VTQAEAGAGLWMKAVDEIARRYAARSFQLQFGNLQSR